MNEKKRRERPILNYQKTHLYKINKETWPHSRRTHTSDWSSTTLDELLRVGFHDCEFFDCEEIHAGSAQEFFIACAIFSQRTGRTLSTESDWWTPMLRENAKR